MTALAVALAFVLVRIGIDQLVARITNLRRELP